MKRRNITVEFTAHARLRWYQRIEMTWNEEAASQMVIRSRQASTHERKILRFYCRKHAWQYTEENAAMFRINQGIVFVCENKTNLRNVITVFRFPGSKETEACWGGYCSSGN